MTRAILYPTILILSLPLAGCDGVLAPNLSTSLLASCKGAFAWTLERWEEGRWVGAWGPVVPDCLSAPIVIDEGDVFEDSLRIAGGAFGSNTVPQFDRRDPSGTYRIVWADAYSSYDPDGPPFGELLPRVARISSSFELRYEREVE